MLVGRLVKPKMLVIFAVLLGVPQQCAVAEKIPSEPDMYNDSAGKRYIFLAGGKR